MAEEIDPINATSQGMIRSFVARLATLNRSKRDLDADIKEVLAEAKANGLDPAMIRKVVARLAKDPAKLQMEETLFDLYLHAVQRDLFEKAA